MRERLSTSNPAILALGAVAGAAVARLVAPAFRGSFPVPTGGVGWVTVNQYPKGYDYFVIALLVLCTIAGGVAASFVPRQRATFVERPRAPKRWWPLALATFVLMLFMHDHPYSQMDPFHEGEHLTPAMMFREGARPYRDILVLHGLGADGGLDALVLGDPPSPQRERRMWNVLNAAAIALLAPIAAELCATGAGMTLAVLAGACAVGAGQVPVFPYARLIPVLLATLGLVRYARRGGMRPLLLAFCASTLGLLWSIDTGTYAVAGTIGAFVLMRVGRLEAKPLALKQLLVAVAIAVAAPLVVMLAVRADIKQFVVDSYVTVPRSIDAISSLPAPTGWSWETARYYTPPIVFAFLLVLALRAWARGEREAAARLVIVATLSLVTFRTASGRCGWSHLRFAIPLVGVAIVAFLAEPLFLARKRLAALALVVPLVVYLELVPNVVAGAKFVAGWRGRQSHAGMVPYPFASGKGIYTYPENAKELEALNGFLAANTPPGAPILDLSNERALYYFLGRRPALRCPDIAMLAAPPLFEEAMQQLHAKPPACVIVSGNEVFDQYDGLPNEQRVPWLFAWVEARYPRRAVIGQFTVAY